MTDPPERDLATELLGQIIERPAQSSYEIAERVGEPHTTACDALNDLRLRGLIVDDPRQILTGDNTVLEAQNLRATEEGREWFAQVSPPPFPEDAPALDPLEVWRAVFAVAKPLSAFGEEAQAVQGDYEERGVVRSGASLLTAKRVANRHGYKWSDERRAFYRPWTSRVRVPAVVAVGVLVTVGAWYGSLSSERAALAVTSAATAAAAFAALAIALLPRKP